MPTGTLMIRSCPRLPWQRPAAPVRAVFGQILAVEAKISSVCMLGSA